MEGNQLSGSHFPPGFRFHPTDQELINHYLKRKISSCLPPAWDIMAEIDLYKFNPWELPEKAYFGDKEWFFFSPRDRKYPNGVRPNRAAGAGYWKATGTDKPILAADGFQCIGVKKALVFYNGRPPKGAKTDWVMHEYRLLESSLPIRPKKLKDSMRLDDWVLCRVKQKSPLPEYDEGSLALKPSLPVMNLNESGSFYEPIETEAFLNGSEMSKGGDSDSWSETMGSEYGEIFDTRQQSPPLTVNNSLKRKSFFSSAMEELMQLQPSKRLQCSTDEQYLLQPDFFSLDQDSMEFLTC